MRTSAMRANKFVDSGIKNKNKQKLAEELQKPVVGKIVLRKANAPFIDNICGADIAEMQLISKFDKGIPFLLCAIDSFSKYAWVILLKDKKGITITNAFQKFLKNSILKEGNYG